MPDGRPRKGQCGAFSSSLSHNILSNNTIHLLGRFGIRSRSPLQLDDIIDLPTSLHGAVTRSGIFVPRNTRGATVSDAFVLPIIPFVQLESLQPERQRHLGTGPTGASDLFLLLRPGPCSQTPVEHPMIDSFFNSPFGGAWTQHSEASGLGHHHIHHGLYY